MLSLSEIKTGKKILWEGEPFVVLFDQHSKMGRAGAVLRTKLKNLKNGAILNKTFQGSEKVENAEIEEQAAQFLYQEGTDFCFMNSQNFEQFSLSQEIIGENKLFLKEGAEIKVFYFENQPINIQLPIKIELEVVEAPPAVRGNTVDGGSKQVILETGAKVTTPLFIKTGDVLRINTETGAYVERIQ